jgi:hypothetical protein
VLHVALWMVQLEMLHKLHDLLSLSLYPPCCSAPVRLYATNSVASSTGPARTSCLVADVRTSSASRCRQIARLVTRTREERKRSVMYSTSSRQKAPWYTGAMSLSDRRTKAMIPLPSMCTQASYHRGAYTHDGGCAIFILLPDAEARFARRTQHTTARQDTNEHHEITYLALSRPPRCPIS